MQIGFVCLVAPAFGGGVLALDFRRGATRRKIPEPPCRGKRDLRPGRVAGFRPLIVAVGCESPVRNFANLQKWRSVSGAIVFIGVWIAPGKETPMSGIPPLTLRGLGSSHAPPKPGRRFRRGLQPTHGAKRKGGLRVRPSLCVSFRRGAGRSRRAQASRAGG